MDGVPTVSKTVQELLNKERETSLELKKIRESEYMLDKLEKELKEIKTSILAAEKEHDERQENVTLLKSDKTLTQALLEAWSQTAEETKAILEKETQKMDQLRKSVWNKREMFCASVSDFVESHGLLAHINRKFDQNVRRQMQEALFGTEALMKSKKNKEVSAKKVQAMHEIAELENEVKREEVLEEEARAQLDHTLQLIKELEKEYEEGPEFVRLRNAFKYSRCEVSRLRAELEQHVKSAAERKMETFSSNEDQFSSHDLQKSRANNIAKQTHITEFMRVKKSPVQNPDTFTTTYLKPSTTNFFQADTSYATNELQRPSSKFYIDQTYNGDSYDSNKYDPRQGAQTGSTPGQFILASASRKTKNSYTPGDIYKDIMMKKQREEQKPKRTRKS